MNDPSVGTGLSQPPVREPVASPWVCSTCMGESYLRTRAKSADAPRTCLGCRDECTEGVELAWLADQVKEVLEEYFRPAPTEPETVEQWISVREEGYFEPSGEALGDIVANLVECTPAIADAVCSRLHECEDGHRMARQGDEPRYLPGCHYVEVNAFSDLAQYIAFQQFEQRLRYQARYFHPDSRALLASVFKDVHILRTRDGGAVTVQVVPGAVFSQLYRARVFQSADPLKRALIAPDRELGPPPAAIAPSGRMNAAHIALFYGATTPGTALAEVRPPAHSQVLIGRFDVQRPLRLLDVAALQSVLVAGSPFNPDHRARVRDAEFLRMLGQRISRPILPDHQTSEYLVTQAIADYLAYECTPPFDGMIYPSTQSDDGVNVVLFHGASRVKPWAVPNTSIIEADLTRSTEDGPEPDYDVVEWVNDPRAPNLGSDPAVGTDDRSDDARPITLHLVSDSLEVRHAERVDYTTSAYRVNRRTIDRSEPSEF